MVEQAEEARAAAAATVKTPGETVGTDTAVTIGSNSLTAVVMRMILKTIGDPGIITTIGAEAEAGVAAEVIKTIITRTGALPRATHPMVAWAIKGSSRSTPTAITLKADASSSATWPSRRSGST